MSVRKVVVILNPKCSNWQSARSDAVRMAWKRDRRGRMLTTFIGTSYNGTSLGHVGPLLAWFKGGDLSKAGRINRHEARGINHCPSPSSPTLGTPKSTLIMTSQTCKHA